MGVARYAALILGITLLWPLRLPAEGEARSAAFGYVAQARVLSRAGSDSGALVLLERALQIDPEFSEACYLYAQIELRTQEGTRAGIGWLKKAIASATWMDSRPEIARTDLARALVRTRRYGEARSVLAARGERPGLGSLDDPEAALLWGLSIAGQGDAGGAARYLSQALQRYPQDRRVYLHLARVLQRLGRTAEALEVLSRGRRALPEAAELSLEAARLESSRAARLQLLDEYAQRGGRDPAGAALALALQPKDAQAWLERFLSQGGNARLVPLDMLIGYFRPRSGRQAEALLAAVRDYSGERTVDADEDGYYEELYQVSGGSLERWRLDQDQDGVPEAEVRFAAGVPQNLSAGGLEYRYSSYPFLAEVAAQEAGAVLRTYKLQPFQRRLELFRGPTVTAAPSRLSPLRLSLRQGSWPGEQVVRGWSYVMEESEPGTAVVQRRFTLEGGAVVRMEASPNGRGRYGHFVEYTRGVPVFGARDLDDDGRYELAERYAGGKLASLTLDQDGDGRPEYRQEFTPGGIRTSWDYNQDGVADRRELENPGGEMVVEFSSRLNGSFDSRAVFRSGLLTSFQRAGQNLAVIPSTEHSLYWVGRPGGPVEPFLGLAEGLQRVGGREYFLFAHRGTRYVVAQ